MSSGRMSRDTGGSDVEDEDQVGVFNWSRRAGGSGPGGRGVGEEGEEVRTSTERQDVGDGAGGG